jgi:hypothetical protein
VELQVKWHYKSSGITLHVGRIKCEVHHMAHARSLSKKSTSSALTTQRGPAAVRGARPDLLRSLASFCAAVDTGQKDEIKKRHTTQCPTNAPLDKLCLVRIDYVHLKEAPAVFF